MLDKGASDACDLIYLEVSAHTGVNKKKGSTLRYKQYSFSYPLDTHFPLRRFVWGWEGGGLYACEQEGVFYVVIDERTLADFLMESNPVDTSVLQQLLTIFELDSEDERCEYLNDLVLQFMGYDPVQEPEEEKTYVAHDFNHRVTLSRTTEITREMANSIRREGRRHRTS